LEAEKTDKLVFIDAYAKWCGPCKRMAKEVFTLQEVGDFYNENFINVKLDMEVEDGMSFGKKYPVSAYPTLFFINSQGEVIKKIKGGQQGDQLIAHGKTAIKSYDRSGIYADKYKEGDRSFDLMVKYVKELNKVGKPSLKIANDYIDSNPDITLGQKAEFLMVAVTECDSRLYDKLIALKNPAIIATNKESFEAKVTSACRAMVPKAVEFEYEDLLLEGIEKYKKAKVGDAKKFESQMWLDYHKQSGDYNKWKALAEKYIKKYGKKEPSVLQQQIKTLSSDFSYEKDSKPYACQLCKELIKKDDSLGNYSQYIKLLMDCREYEEARKWTEKAIDIAESRDKDTKEFSRIITYLDKI